MRDTRRATLLSTQAIDLERTLRHAMRSLGDDRILASYRQQLVRYRELSRPIRTPFRMPRSTEDLEATLVWLDGLQDLRKGRAGKATSPVFRLQRTEPATGSGHPAARWMIT